jgi:ATP-dependent helicase Lhr and Lhr-like helicase
MVNQEDIHSLDLGKNWFVNNRWEIYPFQAETWARYQEGYSGLVNAPTGNGIVCSSLHFYLQTKKKV